MSKIKEDIDIKELKSFGFRKYKYYSGNTNYYGRDRIYIDEKTKIVSIPTKTNRYDVDEYIQDLIQAQIVEKI